MKTVFIKSCRYGVLALTVAAASAHAATDLAPITAAQTDALAVVAALVALGIAVWGANYVRTKFFR